MKFVFGIILLFQCSAAVDLFLPLADKEADKFIIRPKHFCNGDPNTTRNLRFKATYYEGKDSLIRGVIFHNLLIFNDHKDYHQHVRRFVVYSILKTRIIVSIITRIDGVSRFDAVYNLNASDLVEVLENPDRSSRILEHQDTTAIGQVLSSILVRTTRDMNNDCLDFEDVDEEPELPNGSGDMTVEDAYSDIEALAPSDPKPLDLSMNGPNWPR